jgi:hypothetical protein
LRFRAWDSGDLAQQISTMLHDETLWRRFSENGRAVVEFYSVSRLADRVLIHLGLPGREDTAVDSEIGGPPATVAVDRAAARSG